MTELPILYTFCRCPYAMRARMAIAVSKTQVELREIQLRDKPAEMLLASPKGTVPVLVLPGGSVIDESLDIMHWALAQSDPEGWLKQLDEVIIAGNDGSFKTALDRYKYPHRYGLSDGLENRDTGLEYLQNLDTILCNQPFLDGTNRGFTDIALFPFIRQYAATDKLWFDAQPLPALQSWLETLVGSALFVDIMLPYPRWQSGDAITGFPNPI